MKALIAVTLACVVLLVWGPEISQAQTCAYLSLNTPSYVGEEVFGYGNHAHYFCATTGDQIEIVPERREEWSLIAPSGTRLTGQWPVNDVRSFTLPEDGMYQLNITHDYYVESPNMVEKCGSDRYSSGCMTVQEGWNRSPIASWISVYVVLRAAGPERLANMNPPASGSSSSTSSTNTTTRPSETTTTSSGSGLGVREIVFIAVVGAVSAFFFVNRRRSITVTASSTNAASVAMPQPLAGSVGNQVSGSAASAISTVVHINKRIDGLRLLGSQAIMNMVRRSKATDQSAANNHPLSRRTVRLGRFLILTVVLACFLPAAGCGTQETAISNIFSSEAAYRLVDITLALPSSFTGSQTNLPSIEEFAVRATFILGGLVLPFAVIGLMVSFFASSRLSITSFLLSGFMFLGLGGWLYLQRLFADAVATRPDNTSNGIFNSEGFGIQSRIGIYAILVCAIGLFFVGLWAAKEYRLHKKQLLTQNRDNVVPRSADPKLPSEGKSDVPLSSAS